MILGYKYKKITLFILIFIIVFAVFKKQEFSNYKEKGSVVVEKIFNFKKLNSRLPNSISEFEINLEMGEGPYYEKLNDTTFIVFFNIGFDDKIIFNSNKKIWE